MELGINQIAHESNHTKDVTISVTADDDHSLMPLGYRGEKLAANTSNIRERAHT
jgi:hypothetical protein